MDNIINNISTNIAFLIETFPLARGLFFFFGWFLSASLSLISFIIYTIEDIKENIIKEIKTEDILFKLNILLPKNNGNRTNPFFNQCLILNNFK